MREPDGLPTDPADLRLLLHALVDGELDAGTSLALERRMAADAALGAEHARLLALKAALSRLPRPEPSDALTARLAQRVAEADRIAETAARPRKAGRWSWSDPWRAMAASIAVGAMIGSAATFWAAEPSRHDDLADAIASSHRRALLAASPIDIASSDRHTVKPWLDNRIGVSPPAVDLAPEGFVLLGGRVDMLGGAPVPTLVYRHKEHLITLVAAPQGAGGAGVLAPTDLSAGGFGMVHWTDDAFSYWAVSDMERPELDSFCALFRARTAGG